MPYRFNVICLFIFCLFVATAGLASESPLSMSPLSSAVEKLTNEKIYLDRQWLLLGHYQKSFSGVFRSMVNGSEFFLAGDGASSPENEMKATLTRFLEGSIADRTKYQCGYLARRDFIVRRFGIASGEIFDCPDFRVWLQKLNPKKLSLIYATGSFHESASSFGHVFLRLENPDRSPEENLLNYGLNYSARTEKVPGTLYALYGLFGYFPGTYGMAPYHHLIKQYTNMDGRDLWEYELNLTPEEIERMTKHMLELEKGFFNYYFLDDNCARMIAVALEVARPELDISRPSALWVLPLDTVKLIVKNGLVTRTTFRPSLRTEFEESYKPLSPLEKRSIKMLFDDKVRRSDLLAAMTSNALESAQNYFALKGASDFQMYKEINYALALERAKRPESTPAARAMATGEARHVAPDLGPGSSSFSAGIQGLPGGADVAVLSARAVGYDLLDSHTGVAAFSELILGSAEFSSPSTHELTLSNITLFRILSSYPVTALEAPVSWGLTIERNKGWEIPVKAGYSIDLGASRWMNFLALRIQEPVDGKPNLVPAFESELSATVFTKLHLLAGLEIDTAVNHDGIVVNTDWLSGVAWEANRNLLIRLEKFDQNRGVRTTLRQFF